MRKLLLLLVMLSLVVSAAIAQDDDEESEEMTMTAPEITWECPEGFAGQELSVYNWATYIGETTITTFEELCDVTVTYDVYDSNEALIARLRNGNPGYDVAFPGDYAVAIMVREGLIEMINYDNVPNYANIADRWLGLYYDPDEEYTVPYLWGTFGVAYNTESITEPITSWADVWNYDGAVAWQDDNRSMLSIALNLLGYEPNSEDAGEIAEAGEYLLENGNNVVYIADDDGEAQLQLGEVEIALEYNGDVFQIMDECDCDTYSYVIPEEGSVVDIALMVKLADGPNPELAEVFMDYVLDPAVNAMIVNDVLYATTNQAAIDSGYIAENVIDNAAIFPSEESLENLYFLQDIGEAEQSYNDAWDELLIFIGG